MPESSLPDLPRAITSFGAAVCGDSLFIYGGHFGHAHEYYTEGQSHDFLQLDLNNPTEWQHLPQGPRIQGLALVSYQRKLYRVGGFSARNAKGEDQDLWSIADAAVLDLDAPADWQDLPPLPEPRSSHDAIVIGDTIYVAGGWQLQGGKESEFHQSAWRLNLSSDSLAWEALPTPPFQRRALAVESCGGKLYVIGGMEAAGEPTTRVAIFDPVTNEWSEGPSLAGSPMSGFGPAACSLGDSILVSTYEGSLQKLNAARDAWEIIGQSETARFFHQVVPMGSNEVVLIAGASMETGKFKSLERITIP